MSTQRPHDVHQRGCQRPHDVCQRRYHRKERLPTLTASVERLLGQARARAATDDAALDDDDRHDDSDYSNEAEADDDGAGIMQNK